MRIALFSILFLSVVITVLSGCKTSTGGGIKALPNDTVVTADTNPTVVTTPAYDTTDNVEFTEATLDADLEKLVAEKLKPVYFEYNSFSLTSASSEDLAVAGTFINSRPSMRVLVEGHCDERGTADYNMGLGEQRAKAVKEFLITYGVPSTRLETTSWGKEHLEQSACTDDDCHSRNRRVAFKVLSK